MPKCECCGTTLFEDDIAFPVFSYVNTWVCEDCLQSYIKNNPKEFVDEFYYEIAELAMKTYGEHPTISNF